MRQRMKDQMSGPAPVSVAEIYRALAVAPAGVRPYPVAPGSESMRALPVRVFANAEGEAVAVELPVTFWVLQPHRSKSTDPETGATSPERVGSLSFTLSVPDGYRLVRDKPAEMIEDIPNAAEPLPPDSDAARAPETMPEFEGVDPEVFAFNPERLAAIQREANRKKPPGSGAEAP